MYISDAKRLTTEGARKIKNAAVKAAEKAGIPITVAVVDSGGHLLVLERMDGGKFHSVHSATTKAVCAASNKRNTGSTGAVGQSLDVLHALGPMCTRSTLPRYIQCTGKPKSGCGPLVMPRMRAYQSRVASISSAATRKCSMWERGMH